MIETFTVITIAGTFLIAGSVKGVIGQRVRKSLSETKFRKIFFISIFVLGAFIIAKSVFSLNKIVLTI